MDLTFNLAAQDIASTVVITGLAMMVGGFGVAAGKRSRREISNSMLAQGLFGFGAIAFVGGLMGGMAVDFAQILNI